VGGYIGSTLAPERANGPDSFIHLYRKRRDHDNQPGRCTKHQLHTNHRRPFREGVIYDCINSRHGQAKSERERGGERKKRQGNRVAGKGKSSCGTETACMEREAGGVTIKGDTSAGTEYKTAE